MFYRDQPVHSVSCKLALQEFIDFLGDKPVILVGHSIKAFDCHVLLNAAKACGVQEQLHNYVAGYLDTLPYFRNEHKGLQSYKQEHLFQHFIGEDYDAHNALADVVALMRIIDHVSPTTETQNLYTFQHKYILQVQQQVATRKTKMVTYKSLISEKVFSKGMAEKAAGSGLTANHLHPEET